MWGLNDVLTHSIAYGMGEEEGRAKAEREKKASSNWHTGTPTEEGLYLVFSNVDGYNVEYFEGDKWADDEVICEAWQKINPYKEKEDGREETETSRH